MECKLIECAQKSLLKLSGFDSMPLMTTMLRTARDATVSC